MVLFLCNKKGVIYLALKHSVYDTDAHFKIDPVTRTIKNESSGKNVLIQYDHNSERFTFEIPRMIDGHDMSLCDIVQVHYINGDSKNKDFANSDIYNVDDLGISPDSEDVVICSWLISGNATGYAGNLSFLLKFKCIDDSGNCVYSWNTAVCNCVFISPGIDNWGTIETDFPDALAQIDKRIDAIEQGGYYDAVLYTPQELTDEQKAQARDNIGVASCDYDVNVKSIAHRGYSLEAPENTAPAYVLAKKKGFKYVECDVRFTSDGIPVLMHLDNIASTSNGTGNISSMTLAKALQYDYGSWKSPVYAGTSLLTFAEFIALCRGLGLHPYIELKMEGATEQQIRELVDIVNKNGMAGKVTWIAFSHEYINYIADYVDNARLGYLCTVNESNVATVVGWISKGHDAFIDTDYTSLSEQLVDMCASANVPLEVYTVNNEDEIVRLSLYVTGITSDWLISGKVLRNFYTSGNAGKWEVVKELTDKDILFGSGWGNGAPSYTTTNATRAIYPKFDIPVDPGYIYKVEYTTAEIDYETRFAIHWNNETVLANVDAGTSFPAANYQDSGWVYDIPYIVVPPEVINGSPVANMRLAFSRNDNANVEDGFITGVVISRKRI